MAKQLTPQQAKFCSYYIETGNAYESAIKSGYSKSTANNATALLVRKNEGIAERIKNNEEDIIRASNWSKARIISELESIYLQAKQADQIGNASKVLELISKLTNAMPNANHQTKEINVKFESLLKDITPITKTISDTYEAKLIN
jgi:phage terminase small subunit